MRTFVRGFIAVATVTALVALLSVPNALAQDAKGSPGHIRAVTNAVDDAAIKAAGGADNKDWLTYGLDYAETRFSKLKQITTENVKQLGLKWSFNLESIRGVEATPIVVDGIMYVSTSWSVVHAVDARNGKKIWTYDPGVNREAGYKGCCDVVNRGVALYKGKVYVGAYDGKLHAIDAVTGAKVWEKDTIIDRNKPYTITGAPRVANGKVIIGNGGAEYGVRGYVTAYNAETGEQAWRWFTVPGDPSKPFEDESMAAAAKTWDPAGKWWINGGGGTAWDSIIFDPELNLVYIGTGNGSPWNHFKRSPAGGDNLYLSSIVALNADTGKYVWHYQENPGDHWDYTATQPLMLADLMIDGAQRKVIMHAPKNGFFFVVDRTNGKFISAKNFVNVNWATGYDGNGRPIEIPEARLREKARDTVPGPFGAHNWHPMSFSPETGLVYIPAQNIPLTLMEDPTWVHDENKPGQFASGIGWNTAFAINAVPPTSKPFGKLIAWDPVKQAEAWSVDHASPWNGGTLATAGNLVFQGLADGRFTAFNAKTGEKLWESPTGTGIVAGPATYLVDGVQYVSIAVGWGGAFGVSNRIGDKEGPGTVFTFAVGGKTPMPEFAKVQLAGLISGIEYKKEDVTPGLLLYVSNCVVCHGIPGGKGGNVPNLGYVASESISNLQVHLFKGPHMNRGMPDFTGKLNMDQVTKLKAFIAGTADAIRPKQ